MTRDKSADQTIRKNISMRRSVIAIGEGLVGPMHKSSFSQLLTDLIMEAQSRQASGGAKGPEQYLIQIVDLLEKNTALEAKLKEKAESFKVDQRTLREALALCEADLKQARSSKT